MRFSKAPHFALGAVRGKARPIVAAVGLAALAGFAVALSLGTAVPAQAEGPRVTLYSRDLGFVREERTIEIVRDTVRITDVPERLDFASVRLAVPGADVTRLAFRYDVATGGGLVDRARGSRVRVTTRGDRVTEGVLVASDGEWLVVRSDDGSLHTLARAAVETIRLANPPAALSLRPTLEAVVEGARRGRSEAELSYLTGGMSWSAEHVLVRRSETTGTWTSRVSIDNQTGRDFVDASVKLVAGDPARVRDGMPPPSPMVGRMAGVANEALQKMDMSEESFADYHLYTLDRPATLRDRETQSLVMHETRDVPIAPRYLYRGGDPRGVLSQIEIRNDAKSSLGMAIPGGRVRVFEADASGDLQFTGESRIPHVAADEKMTIDVGRAFDLVAERREVTNRRISDREREYQIEVKLRNQKKTSAVIVVEEPVGGDFEVTQQSHPSQKKDANTLRWSLTVPAGKEVVLTYTVRVRY